MKRVLFCCDQCKREITSRSEAYGLVAAQMAETYDEETGAGEDFVFSHRPIAQVFKVSSEEFKYCEKLYCTVDHLTLGIAEYCGILVVNLNGHTDKKGGEHIGNKG